MKALHFHATASPEKEGENIFFALRQSIAGAREFCDYSVKFKLGQDGHQFGYVDVCGLENSVDCKRFGVFS